MSVTRTPLCSVKVCPAPRDPDAHVCPHCGGIEVQHQHVDPKRMGGSPSRDVPTNIVMICPWLHEEITLHRLSDAIIDIFGERLYRVWDIHNNTVCEYKPYWIQCASTDTGISVSTAEAHNQIGAGIERMADFAVDSVPAPDNSLAVVLPQVATVGSGGLAGPLRPFLDMDYEEWRSWGPRLAHNLNASRWLLGEWLLDGEQKWGQMYTQAEAETGLDYSTLTSYRSVVKAYREAELLPAATTSFSVLSVLAPVVRRDAEIGERLLFVAEEDNWTGEDARREVKALTGAIEHETRLCDMGYSHRL